MEAHGFSLTHLPFTARATCPPFAFRRSTRVSTEALSPSPTVSLGVAVDLSHNGLVVPVVRTAEDLTVSGLAKAMRRLIDKARSGKLGPTICPEAPIRSATTAPSNDVHGAVITLQVAISDRRHPAEAAVVSTPEGAFVALRMMGMVGQLRPSADGA